MRLVRPWLLAAALVWMLVWAVAHALAHPAPRFYHPAGVVQGTPVGQIDQFHQEDHLAMLEYAVGGWTAAHTAALVEDVGLPSVMTEIAFWESQGHNPEAHRSDVCPPKCPSGDYGLWQINWGSWGADLKAAGIIRSAEDLFVPRVNAEAAWHVYVRQGLTAWWVCRESPGRGPVDCL